MRSDLVIYIHFGFAMYINKNHLHIYRKFENLRYIDFQILFKINFL